MTDHLRGDGDARRDELTRTTREALERALAEVETPAQADQVIANLNAAAAGVSEPEVANSTASLSPRESAREISEAAAGTPGVPRTEAVITEVASQISSAGAQDEAPLSEGVVAATNPQANDGARRGLQRKRTLLHEALLRDLGLFKAADIDLFLRINHLPHPPVFNRFMSRLTKVMLRGDAWVVGLLISALINGKRERKVMIDVVPPLWLATATVEYPIKYFFRRRRPFVSLLQAIVVGKKPGSYSFPSGHSASSFAAATLLSRHHPRLAPAFFFLATLVGFSRIYLGAHYPSDVITGATAGTFFGAVYQRLCASFLRWRRRR